MGKKTLNFVSVTGVVLGFFAISVYAQQKVSVDVAGSGTNVNVQTSSDDSLKGTSVDISGGNVKVETTEGSDLVTVETQDTDYALGQDVDVSVSDDNVSVDAPGVEVEITD